jgi:tetratricopeptide (TPR) repeat protein
VLLGIVLVGLTLAGLYRVSDWLFNVRPYLPPPQPVANDDPSRREEIRRAFADTAAPEPADPETLAFFSNLNSALQRGDSAAVNLFDTRRMFEDVARTAAFENSRLPSDPNAGGAQFLRDTLTTSLRTQALIPPWDGIQVRRVVPAPGGRDVTVYARHTVGSQSVPFCWRLTRDGARWKAYDVEDLRSRVRYTEQVAELLGSITGKELPSDLRAAQLAMQEAAAAVAGKHYDRAAARLAGIRQTPLPRCYEAARSLLEATVAVHAGDDRRALEWADKADRLNPNAPAVDWLRATAHAKAGRWAEAAKYAREYADLLGPDPAACLLLGTALAELGQPAEAAGWFRKGLKDAPGRADLKEALDRVTPRPASGPGAKPSG